MLQRIMGELDRRFGIGQQIPDRPEALRSAFANWLHMAHARAARLGTRIVLVIDALNQLEDRDGAPDLVWLPPVIPERVRLIVSRLPGRPLEELHRRGWPLLQVKPLEVEERLQLIEQYLPLWGKRLSPAQVKRIASAPQAANPLYLRALLDELRVFGKHERLDAAIDDYLAADSVTALYRKILKRYEQDYERDRPHLVRDAMTLLWAARRGLSETELLELLGADGQPLPRAHWSPLHLAAEHALINRNGLLGFSHAYLRQAVEEAYLPDEGSKRQAHLRLAAYFERQSRDARQIDELPWQLVEAEAWERLYDLLGDLEFLAAAWEVNRFEVMTYWARLEADSRYRIEMAYQSLLAGPEPHHSSGDAVAELLAETGRARYAIALRRRRFACLMQRGRIDDAIGELVEQAHIHNRIGETRKAIEIQEKVVEMYRARLRGATAEVRDGARANLALALGNLGQLLLYTDPERALIAIGEEGTLWQDLGFVDQFAHSSCSKALALLRLGKRSEALEIFNRVEDLCEKDSELAKRLVGARASLAWNFGDVDKCRKLHQERQQIYRASGDLEGLAEELNNEATSLYADQRGDLEHALLLAKEAKRIFERVGHKTGQARALGTQALICRATGDYSRALALHRKEESLCRAARDNLGLWRSCYNQARLLVLDLAQLEEGTAKCREAIHIALGSNQDWDVVYQTCSFWFEICGRRCAIDAISGQGMPGAGLSRLRDLRMAIFFVLYALGRYEEASRFGQELLGPNTPPEVLLTILICLQRSGREEEFSRTGKLFLNAAAPDKWYVGLIELILGRREADFLKSSAEGAVRACEAHYYSGARLKTLGREGEAIREFEACIKIDADCAERHFACAEARMELMPLWQWLERTCLREFV